MDSVIWTIYLRVRSRERRNELKRVWDFISVEYLTLVFPQLVFTWIEAKWNSNQYGFQIRHFDRNEISNRYEIFMWTKFTRSEMNKRKTRWILRLTRMCVWNSLPVLFHCGHFDRNEIWFQVKKYHVDTTRSETPAHVHQNIKSFWNAAEMKRHVNRTRFHAWVHFASHVNVL